MPGVFILEDSSDDSPLVANAFDVDAADGVGLDAGEGGAGSWAFVQPCHGPIGFAPDLAEVAVAGFVEGGNTKHVNGYQSRPGIAHDAIDVGEHVKETVAVTWSGGDVNLLDVSSCESGGVESGVILTLNLVHGVLQDRRSIYRFIHLNVEI